MQQSFRVIHEQLPFCLPLRPSSGCAKVQSKCGPVHRWPVAILRTFLGGSKLLDLSCYKRYFIVRSLTLWLIPTLIAFPARLHWRMFRIIIQHSSHLILHNFPELLRLCALPKHEDISPKNVAKTDYALIAPWSRRMSYFVFRHVFDKSDIGFIMQSQSTLLLTSNPWKKRLIHCSRHCLLKTHCS